MVHCQKIIILLRLDEYLKIMMPIVLFYYVDWEDSVFKTKIRVILKYLNLACESDNALVVETILTSSAVNSIVSELRLISQLLCWNWKIHFRYISREHDRVIVWMIKFVSEISTLLLEVLETDLNFMVVTSS